MAPFGQLSDGTQINSYTITNELGMVLKLINYGAIISECWVPDRNGQLANVVLGFDNLPQYLAKHPRFGSTIGRYANRISNAQFELDGHSYKLAATKGRTSTHGGVVGFDKKVWNVNQVQADAEGSSIGMRYVSVDGEEGFPGNLEVRITFSLSNRENAFQIDYFATTDKPTPINLTNHSYFNLNGAGRGDILDHIVSLQAERYTPVDDEMVPSGEIATVKHTPYDFVSESRKVGDRISLIEGGYDINFVIDKKANEFTEFAKVIDPVSGRVLAASTNQPAFQFFTANSLDGSIKGLGGSYESHAGFCLETQCYPNSVNQANFPNSILRPGETYEHRTRYTFSNLPA